MNLPEARLRSWQPRRPSASLKERIFALPVSRPKFVEWSLRLAPAAASFLVVLSVLHHSGGIPGGGFGHESDSGLLASNALALLPASYQEHNEIYGLTFEWTNRSGSTSSISSFAPGKAN